MGRVLIVMSVMSCLLGCLPDPLPVGNIPTLDSKIVVSSQMVPDQSVAIQLTRSFGALDASGSSDPVDLLNQIAINDALVVLEGMGFADTLNFVGVGVYVSALIPFVDEGLYNLYVDSPTMGKVTATTKVKAAVEFNSLQVSIKDTGFDTLATVAYSLQDIPGRNYYMVNLQYVSTEEPPLPQDFLNPNIFIHLREDEQDSDGELLTETFNAIFRRDFTAGDTVLIQLANVDKGYYDFLQVRKDSRFNFSDFLGEPVNYPTNIVGGLGWFTLHFPDVRLVSLDE